MTALMLIHDLNVRIMNAAKVELIRELTTDPTRDLPTPRSPTPAQKEKTRTLIVGSGYSDVLTHHRPIDIGYRPPTGTSRWTPVRVPSSGKVMQEEGATRKALTTQSFANRAGKIIDKRQHSITPLFKRKRPILKQPSGPFSDDAPPS